MNNESNTGTVLLAFSVGAAIGAGLALLFAPQSGRKTRGQIADMAEDAEGYAKDLVKDARQEVKKARQTGEQWISQAKEYIDDKKAQVAAAVDGGHR